MSTEPPRRRQGLPRPGQPAAATSAPEPASAEVASTGVTEARPAADVAPARRQGLPRSSEAAPATAATSTPPGRRQGLPRSSEAAPAVTASPAPSSPSAPVASAPAPAASAPAPVSPAPAKHTRARRYVIGAIVLIVAAAIVVLVARALVALPAVHDFLTTYPGQTPLPADAPVGIPAWLGWQHFLNAFFLVLIIRSGWLVRTTKRPAASWIRNNTGLIKTKGRPKRISLELWFHLTVDSFWFANGIIFIVLLFATGQWMRIVPTNWAIIPNALSAALQYASLNWPTEDGWVNYNSLQVITYFATVFIAAPLAAITGIRMSGAWPSKAKINRFYPIELARAIHFPVMLYFVVFIIVHVTLVLATGALRNLNHMYGGQDAVNWWGFGIFTISLLVMAAAVLAARPIILAPIAGLMGKVGR